MNNRSTLCIATALLVAGSAVAQTHYHYFEAEDASTLGTNYVSVVDTNVPPFAFNTNYITSTVNKTDQPLVGEEEAAIYSIGDLPPNTLWDLYLRIHVGPDNGGYNDDSFFPADVFWDWFSTNSFYNPGGYGVNGLAGYETLDGAATTADGFHWVLVSEIGPYDSFEGLNLWWACAPREDGLELDAFALVWSGFPIIDPMLDPANAAVELWAGAYEPTLPVSTPTPTVTAYFLDGAGTANTNSITVKLKGAAVTNFTVAYANYATTVSFVPESFLDIPSTNTVQVVVASSPGAILVTNEFTVEVAAEPIVYADATTNNTVMAVSADGPVGAGTAWVVNETDTVDGIWRFRATFGVDPSVTNEPSGTLATLGGVYESAGNSGADNCPRLKTSVSVPTNTYDVYIYFWQAQAWPIRAGLEDTAGTNSLAQFTDANSIQVASDSGGRQLRRGYLGRVDNVSSIEVYVEDLPATDNNTRTWYDGIGYAVAPTSSFPGVYVDATTNNTVMAVSTDGPVGAGTALVVNTTDSVDGIWRFRATFGVPSSTTNEPIGTLASLGGVFESAGNSGADNCPRLKTSISGLPLESYDVYIYFWRDENQSPWTIRAGLEDTPGTNSLTQYTLANSIQVANDSAGREFRRAYLGRVVDVTAFDVYVEDLPATDNNTRTWYDGIGYTVAQGASFDPEITDVSVSGGNVTLTWTSETVATYSILHKTNLTDAVWSPVKTGIAGGDPTTTDSVPVSGASREYFMIQGH